MCLSVLPSHVPPSDTLLSLSTCTALGVVFAMGAFILSYAQIPAVLASPVTQSSTVMRTFEERVTLEQARRRVLTLSMQGYIFFGSSVI